MQINYIENTILQKKIFIIVNIDWFFLSHRLPIALAAQKKGYDVTIVAIDSGMSNIIIEKGLKFIAIPMSRSGVNFYEELKTLAFFIQLYKKNKPDIIHHVAVKPVIYGSLAARVVHIPLVINALSGMGHAFVDSSKRGWLKFFLLLCFRIGFKNPNLKFIFQNKDDYQEVEKFIHLDNKNIFFTKGSGVDLNEYYYTEEPKDKKFTYILTARMLYDKGVVEFIEASKQIEAIYPNQCNFWLVGKEDTENKTGIPKDILMRLCENSPVQWLGHKENIFELLQQSNVFVFPSYYREGLPKSIIESCAVGRPTITTNVTGCRDAVIHNYNGIIIEKQNIPELVNAMQLLYINSELRLEMGKNARILAEKEYSIDLVIDTTLKIYASAGS